MKKHEKTKSVTIVTDISPITKYTVITKTHKTKVTIQYPHSYEHQVMRSAVLNNYKQIINQ